MKNVIMTIILFALSVSLIIGVILPMMNGVKGTGQKSFDSVKSMNNNIKP